MKQYIRTNEEGTAVLDYALLDTADRANLLEDARLWATTIEVDLSETDASDGEKAEAINSAATFAVNYGLPESTDDGDDAEIDQDTKQMIIEVIISELAERYGVEVA